MLSPRFGFGDLEYPPQDGGEDGGGANDDDLHGAASFSVVVSRQYMRETETVTFFAGL